jgi:hypothetical protein
VPVLVFVRVSVVFFSLVIVTEGSVLAARGPANIHIESDGLHSSGAQLLALGLFFFVERGRGCRCADLDDFWKQQTGLGGTWGQCLDRFAASPEAQRIRCCA